jgi:hypothetical protein
MTFETVSKKGRGWTRKIATYSSERQWRPLMKRESCHSSEYHTLLPSRMVPIMDAGAIFHNEADDEVSHRLFLLLRNSRPHFYR